jgi:hypothetical protein
MVVRFAVALLAALAVPAGAGAALPFAQSWSDTTLIALDDDWSGVPGIVGYRGDGLAGGAGADPQEIVADGAATPIDVIANQTRPSMLSSGGVAEFELGDPTVALQGSGTADAPHLILALDTRGYRAIEVSYALRDLDASGADAVQPVALQYRVGAEGEYTNVPAAFVADATTGPSLAMRVTAVVVTLPPAVDDAALVQIRILTADANGADEWVGVDDVRITGLPVDALPPSLTVAIASRLGLLRALDRGLRPRVTVDEAAVVRARIRIRHALAERLGLPRVVGRATRTVEPGTTTRMVVRFRRGARERLATLERVRVRLRVTATDAAGNTRAVGRAILLVR